MQLNPVGKTMDYFQAKQILENDEKFKEDYQKIKKIADRFYRNLNEDVLSKTGLDKLKDYAEVYYHCNTDADRKRWSIGHFTVRKGDFDKYLTRSINTLFHVMVEKLQIDALGELIMGIALICITLPSVNIEWGFLKVLLIITVIPFATLIYTGIKTATAAIAFWTKRSGNITYMFYMVNDFAKYPITIYNNIVRNIITYIIPFAFTAFYPAYYILSGENPLFNIGMTVLIAIVMMVVGVIVWNRGIRSYESAGS